MRFAQKSNIGCAAIATQGKWLVVVELEARSLAATFACRVDEGAPIGVPYRDSPFHGCGNVTGARRVVGCGYSPGGRLHLAQAPGLHTLQLLGDRFLDDGRQVSAAL